MLIAMSISEAPSAIARRASKAFALPDMAPKGNPTTAHAFTSEPRRTRETRGILEVFTHTEWNP
jgi:hypothetical protein